MFKEDNTMMDSNPPLFHQYEFLLQSTAHLQPFNNGNDPTNSVMEECQLPLIDLKGLRSSNEKERVACRREIFGASEEWGFFQVINHGICTELLSRMNKEQMKLFGVAFEKKFTSGILDNSYRWGTPTATHPNQFSWSEAFHIPLTKVSEAACYGEFIYLRYQFYQPSSSYILLLSIVFISFGSNTKNIVSISDDMVF